MNQPRVEDDAAWEPWRRQWRLREDTIYLNHGSFGPPPEPVRAARRVWMDRLDEQPMDFYVRQFEPELLAARARLAAFVGTAPGNLVFAENATFAMNVVADSFPLRRGDEVLLTNHEYGAVRRIWRRRCERAGIEPPKTATLAMPFVSAEQVVDELFAAVTAATRLIVVSHITSATATILPVAKICARATALGISVCIDGPHAPAQIPLDIDALDCDFYVASCHKWLSAPFGSGFLYAHPRQQAIVEPQLLSWGRLLPDQPKRWDEQFTWSGTRDPSPYLTVPAAIDFIESIGLEAFRARTHFLAQYARRRLEELVGNESVVPDNPDWYGSMTLVPLPPGDALPLQTALWQRYGIEVPIIDFEGQRYIRVSCHLYNTQQDIDRLVTSLGELLAV